MCFVGIGLPSTAANLARRLYDPAPVLVYESGCIGSKPTRLPLSIGDGELAETADAVVSVPEIFAYWLQAGRIDVGFLGGAQLDRFANINSTVIGSYDAPRTRLPGAGGAPEIAASAGQVMVIMRQSAARLRRAVRLPFVDGLRRWPGRSRAPRVCAVADPGWSSPTSACCEPDPETCELVMTARCIRASPATTARQPPVGRLRFAADLGQTELPTEHELAVLRELQAA